MKTNGHAKSGTATRNAGQAKVLIVDDNSEQAHLYRSFIDDAYDVTVEYTASAAQMHIRDGTHDVVLLDRRLPQKNADELLAELDQGVVRDTRIAMVTAVEPSQHIRDLPIDDYKIKPVDRTEITAVVQTLLLQDEFHTLADELFQLTSKRAALKEANKHQTPHYNELSAKIEDRRERIDDILDTIRNNSIFRTFPTTV